MTELDSWSKDLILAAKGADDPSAAQRARVRASLLAATAGAGVAGAGIAGSGAAGAATTGKTALWLKLFLGVVSIGAVTGVGYGVYEGALAGRSRTPERTDTATAGASLIPPRVPAPTDGAEGVADQEPIDDPEAARAPQTATRTAPSDRTRQAPAAAKSGSKPGLAEEVALIARARSAVQSGNASEAQKLLAQHRREFPRGSLGLERSGLELILACRGGGGKSQARSFLKRFGKTPIAGSVRSACGISE